MNLWIGSIVAITAVIIAACCKDKDSVDKPTLFLFILGVGICIFGGM